MIEIDGDTYKYGGQDVGRMDESELRSAMKELMQKHQRCKRDRERYREGALRATGVGGDQS